MCEKNHGIYLSIEGLKRPSLGFEFSIDTGSHTPYCCKKPKYGPNEGKVIMKHLQTLLSYTWVEECTTGGWFSHIVLVQKPHQEHIKDIKDFVCRMCMSYRDLNRITNPFEYPIYRCKVAIEGLGDRSGTLFFITLDVAQGYHQIQVRSCDKEKLATYQTTSNRWQNDFWYVMQHDN